MRILGRVITGIVTAFGFAAWRRYFSKGAKLTPQDSEKAKQRKSEELAVSGLLRRVAANQQEVSSQGTSPPFGTTLQTSCDNCGKPVSVSDEDAIYRRFERGAFIAFCSEDCHQKFLKKHE